MNKLFKPFYLLVVIIALIILKNSLSNNEINITLNLIFLLLLAVFIEAFQTRKENMAFSLSISSIILLLVIFGPLAAFLGSSLSFLVGTALGRKINIKNCIDSFIKIIFNISQGIISIFLSYKVMKFLNLNIYNTRELWKLLMVISVYYITNAILITCIISFQTGKFVDELITIKKNYLLFCSALVLTPILIYLYIDRGLIGLSLIIILIIPVQKISELHRRLHAQEKELFIDNLTGIHNLKYFDSVLEKKLEKRDEFSLLMIDLDGFKQINDNYGHVAGNLVLKEVANSIRDLLSSDDLICRYGGDEFCIIINKQTNVKDIAQKIIYLIENLEVTYERNIIRVGLSIGIFSYRGEEISKEELINKADLAMYSAKKRKNIFNDRNALTL